MMSDFSQTPKSKGALTATVLFVVAALHVLWGLGSSFPFRDRSELADSVVGTERVPGFFACMAVALALSSAGLLVTGLLPLPRRLRGPALHVVTFVLATRGIAGAMGRTSALSPGSDSTAFTRLDKRLYSPLCLWLAAGVRRSI